MKRIDFYDLRHTETDARDIEVFAESWGKRSGFSLYETLPRPTSALFLLCGEVTARFISSDGSVCTARQGDTVLIPRRSLYRVEVEGGTGGQTDTYTVNFNLYDGGEELAFTADSILRLPQVTGPQTELRAAALCDAAHRADGSADPHHRNQLRIRSEFFALLDAVIGANPDSNGSYYPIRAGVEALRNDWSKNTRIEYYAALCGVSCAYFYRCFRAWSGQSPVEYRNGIRLSNAETMLRETDMRIGEISSLVGFEDPFYFCRLFTRQYGSSPRDYRGAWSEGRR